ncbi:threonine/serine exporter ThrE family protein [Micrococcus sp. HSID17227]|uniref:threonine/serine ThrE exporter family protein n=1 Tax=Micrococcus sp. HSID17227 TaxID=2419506 RepID=UPI000FC1A457|nr:threonine/serine exporter family protein [Micrococcus sp. HSID17227]RUQ41839.1 threonine/serine exporter family protein [Micrococcus sp. HSID17227]
MEQEGTQEPARFDPRIAEPPAVPTLIPVLRPAGAEDAAAVGDLAIDPEDPGLLDLDPAESAHPAAAAGAVGATEPRPPVVRPAAADPEPEPEEPAEPEAETLPEPAADAPLTEPPLSEQVPTSVLAPADADGALPAPDVIPAPDITVPDPVVPVGPPEKRGRRRGRRSREVFVENLPTQALVLADRLHSSPYGRRMRSTLQQRRAEAQALEARTTLDFALKLGETMFSFGAASLDVETSIIVATQAYGILETEVDLTNQSISLNYAPDSSRGEAPFTLQRVVRSSSVNFEGLVAVHRLVEEIAAGEVDRAEAQRRLVEIRHQPKPFPAVFEVLFSGVFVACFVPFIGGTWTGAALGMVSTWLVFWLKVQADKARFPEIFSTMFGAITATVIALMAHALDLPVNPALVIAGGIMMLLPTARFVTAVQDAIHGFPVTAAGRFLSALLVFAGVMAGIMIAVGIGDLLGFEQLDLAEAGTLSYPPLLLLGLVMAAGMADAVVEQSRWPQILACGLVSGAGFGAYLAAQQVGVSDRLVPAVAAAAVGFLGRLVAQRLAAPALVIVLPSMLFLLPGLTMFRSVYGFTVETGATLLGVEGLFNAAVIVVAIAAGVAFGNTLAKPITDRMGTLLPTELVMHQRG